MSVFKAKKYADCGTLTMLVLTDLETEFEVLEALRACDNDSSYTQLEVSLIGHVTDISVNDIPSFKKIDRIIKL